MKSLYSILSFAGLTMLPVTCFAADSYRWLHVTIETPWLIFLILLPMVLVPAILMAVLYWKFAGSSGTKQAEKKDERNNSVAEVQDSNADTKTDNISESIDR